MIRRVLSLSIPALALAACATAGANNYRVEAKVRAMQSGAHDASGIRGVAGADVALQCPDASQNRSLGKTAEDGTLDVEGQGAIPVGCKIAVTQAGYQSTALPVASVCSAKAMDQCTALDIRAILAPEGGSNAATR